MIWSCAFCCGRLCVVHFVGRARLARSRCCKKRGEAESPSVDERCVRAESHAPGSYCQTPLPAASLGASAPHSPRYPHATSGHNATCKTIRNVQPKPPGRPRNPFSNNVCFGWRVVWYIELSRFTQYSSPQSRRLKRYCQSPLSAASVAISRRARCLTSSSDGTPRLGPSHRCPDERLRRLARRVMAVRSSKYTTY